MVVSERCSTISDMGTKSWANSTPGDRIGGGDVKGEFTSRNDVVAELDPSALYSSMFKQGGWAIPALPNPSKMSISHAVSGGLWSIGLARRGRISCTLARSRGAKRCSPTRNIARMLNNWSMYSSGPVANGLLEDGSEARTSVRSLVMVRRVSI